MEARAASCDWIERYLSQLTTQRQLSAHTISAYRRDLLELRALSAGSLLGSASAGSVPEGFESNAVVHADIRRFASKLHAQGLTPRSIARKLSSWRGFFNWLAREIPLPANPVDGVRAPKRPKALPKALSVDDAVHLVATPSQLHANPEPADLCNRAMFELLYSSGLRVSELAGLDVAYAKAEGARSASLGWIDLDGREVIVTGKGNKMRKVPVGSHAAAALAAWLAVRPAPADGSGALFVSGRGARMSPRVIQLRLKAHGLKVGTGVNLHPHVLRHSFASHVLQSSGDLRAVQDMLGHASITSTQVYTALDFQHLSAVYDQAHPRAKTK